MIIKMYRRTFLNHIKITNKNIKETFDEVFVLVTLLSWPLLLHLMDLKFALLRFCVFQVDFALVFSTLLYVLATLFEKVGSPTIKIRP